MNISELSANQLRRAASVKEQMEKLYGELNSILRTATPTATFQAATAPAGAGKKGSISAAGIARIKAAQKARWAKIKGAATATPSTTAKPAPQKKFTMSASAKAAISKAAKARWAKIKAAQKK